MKDKLYDALNDFLDVIEQLEDIRRSLLLQKEGLLESNSINRQDVVSVINVEIRLLEKALRDCYNMNAKIDKLLLES